MKLWKKFVEGIMIDDYVRKTIELELKSSFDWQCMFGFSNSHELSKHPLVLAYKNPPLAPTLKSSPLQWEQSLVAGHPTHPVRLPYFLGPNTDAFS